MTILAWMNHRSRTFHYHIQTLIWRAKKAGLSQAKIDKLVEIAQRWEDRRERDRRAEDRQASILEEEDRRCPGNQK